MKLEARTDAVTLTLQTNDTATHSVVTDHRPEVEAALRRAALWFEAEVERLLAPPATVPEFDARGRVIGQRIVEANASPLVYHGRKFNPDPLADFRTERTR